MDTQQTTLAAWPLAAVRKIKISQKLFGEKTMNQNSLVTLTGMLMLLVPVATTAEEDASRILR